MGLLLETRSLAPPARTRCPSQALVRSLVVDELSKPKAFYLYTTPPKQVLRDLDLSLFKVQLVPAAHVYFHVADGKGMCWALASCSPAR